MKRLWTHAAWMAVFVLSTMVFAACAPTQDTGGALIGVSAQALSSADVTKVTLTISGPNISPDITQDLVKTGGQWKGIIGQIPVGTGRTFTAEAFDSGNNKIYEGTSNNVTITKGAPVALTILLQQSTPPNPFQNTVPDITALTASAAQIGHDEEIHLAVSASDVDGDSLTYTWSAAQGTFPNGNTGTSVVWRAPSSGFSGNVTLNVEVTDGPKGGKTGASLVVDVQAYHSTGTAKVSVEFNTWPEVSQMTSSVDPVDVGQNTALDVTASDADGDTLSYAWQALGAECQAGSFSSTSVKSPTWTAPATAPSSGTCSLQVTVSDGNGGSTTGTMTVNVGAQTPANFAPKLETTFQSTDQADAGDSVEFRVVASDPEGTALSFTWSDSSGPISGGITNTGSGPYTSKLVWTKPAGTCGQTVTVVIADADGQQTTHNFTVECTSWAQSFGSTGDDQATAIAIDASNNIYVTGYFEGTVNIGGTSLVSAGDKDIFVIKMDSAGAVQWAQRAGGTGDDRGLAIHVDGSYVYIGGHHSNNATFGITQLTTVGRDGFAARLTLAGAWDHVLEVDGPGDEAVTAVYGISGDIIAAGYFTNGASFLKVDNTTQSVNSNAGSQDFFIARMHSTIKKWEWVTTAGGSGTDSIHAITVGSGFAYITGSFEQSITIGAIGTLGPAQGKDAFVASLHTLNGAWEDALPINGSGLSDEGYGVVATATNVFVTGTVNGSGTVGSTNYNSANDDMFVLKVGIGNDVDQVAWFQTYGSGATPNGVGVNGRAITARGSDLWIAGTYSNGALSFPGLAPLSFAAGDGDNAFVVKLNQSDAQTTWAAKGGGPLSDSSFGVCVDSNDKAYVTGRFQGTSDFFTPSNLTSGGGNDIFIWKP